MHYNSVTGLYRFIPFLLIFFTLTVFTTLRSSMGGRFLIQSVDIVKEVRQKPSVKIVT